MYGYEGDDELRGEDGNDTLDGGIGNDSLQGGYGNDTYIASPGFDVISEAAGTDVIVLPAAITAGDVHFIRLSDLPYDLQITVDGLGQIVLDNQFYQNAYVVETLQFFASNIDLTTLSIETIGSAGNDLIYGVVSGAGEDDIFDGREGNDTLDGGSGDDTYYFSLGQDVVNESTGSINDGIGFREGYAPNDISMYRGGYQGKDLIFADLNGNTLTVANNFHTTQNLVEYARFYDSTL